jgi:glutathione peroxidase
MTVFDVDINALSGQPASLDKYRGNAMLVVNVASECGLTPQYAGLQALAATYRERGLVVLGVPCNQFGAQEPGSAAEIAAFCETNYAVTFPMTEKVDVADGEGHAGDIRWNFEKFLVAPDGRVVARFHPRVGADAPELITELEKVLPG